MAALGREPSTPSRGALLRVALAVAALCLGVPGTVGSAPAQDLEAKCRQTEIAGPRLECDVRLRSPAPVSSVAAAVVGGPTLPRPTYLPYPLDGDVSAYLILVDTSDRARGRTIQANAADIRRILGASNPGHDRFGLAALPGGAQDGAVGAGSGPSLRVLTPIGSGTREIEADLDKLRADGAASPIYRSSIEGIRLLASYPATRRGLLLFSDGKSEDRHYGVEDVVREARQASVAIYAFGVAERPADSLHLQGMMRLAEATDGGYFQADSEGRRFGPTVPAAMLQHFSGGGRVMVDLASLDSERTVELRFDTGEGPAPVHRETVRLAKAEAPPKAEPAPAEPPRQEPAVPAPEPEPEPAAGGFLGWVAAHGFESALVGAAVVLLAVAFLAWRSTAGPRPSTEEGLEATPDGGREGPPVAGAPGAAYALLQPVESGSIAFPIATDMVRIGRAPTNDICLPDETISAHHATIVRKRDHTFVVNDLHSLNGIRVNGTRVKERVLCDGDSFAVGGVQFRFVLNRHGQGAS